MSRSNVPVIQLVADKQMSWPLCRIAAFQSMNCLPDDARIRWGNANRKETPVQELGTFADGFTQAVNHGRGVVGGVRQFPWRDGVKHGFKHLELE